MLYGEGVVGLVLIALWVWAIFDVIASDSVIVRNLPKPVWLILVLIFPDIGSIAWLLLGRPAYKSFVPGGAPAPRDPVWVQDDVRRQRYAELDEELDRRIEARRLQEWEDDLRRREQQLGGGSSTDPGELRP